LKEEAVDGALSLWMTRFGMGYLPVVKTNYVMIMTPSKYSLPKIVLVAKQLNVEVSK
jgi:uncharacterized protein YpmS